VIVLRGVEKKDVQGLEKLSHVPGIFNLPSDLDLLTERVLKSQRSFAGEIREASETKYTFVAEDTATGEILATSMIAGQHGTPESPHYFFDVGREERFSSALSSGFIHGTLTLGTSTHGPSEIGALVVDEKHRHAPEKIGRQIFFARFLYLALHSDRFQKQIIAELLPPLNKKGLSPLWEAIGRRFTNMDYWEADQLAAKNKDFIFELFPTGKIYTTFLPADARNAIGKIGKDTLPAQHLLERIGFTYRHQIDPFDGGPHFWGTVSELATTKNLRQGIYAPSEGPSASAGFPREGLLTKVGGKDFRACSAEVSIVIGADAADTKLTVLKETSEIEKTLGLMPGDAVGFVPYN
jgi:arginine N-succinyltransferase